MSQWIVTSCKSSRQDSLSKWISHTTSEAALAIALYSASELDINAMCCFFDFQLMGEFPSIRTYPVTDLLVLGAWSAVIISKSLQYKLIIHLTFDNRLKSLFVVYSIFLVDIFCDQPSIESFQRCVRLELNVIHPFGSYSLFSLWKTNNFPSLLSFRAWISSFMALTQWGSWLAS